MCLDCLDIQPASQLKASRDMAFVPFASSPKMMQKDTCADSDCQHFDLPSLLAAVLRGALSSYGQPELGQKPLHCALALWAALDWCKQDCHQ